MRPRISPIALILAVVMVAAILITRRDFNERNFRIFPGMVYTTASNSQSVNAIFPDGKTMQTPVPGTFPRGPKPYRYKNNVDDRQKSGWKLKNPIPKSPEALARGKVVFDNFCSHCHGFKGRGDGPVAQRSLLAMSLMDTITRERLDGGIFHIITYGRLYMPAHGPLISQDDRWKVIRYLRQLQESQPQISRD